jgi:hypothetical protein
VALPLAWQGLGRVLVGLLLRLRWWLNLRLSWRLMLRLNLRLLLRLPVWPIERTPEPACCALRLPLPAPRAAGR